ncbi:sodium:proton antiporter [bacterium]|nr:sodium:proton antiporter [bacterium]
MFEIIIFILFLTGLIFLFRGTNVSAIIGFICLGNAANLVIFGLSRPKLNSFPFYSKSGLIGEVLDPLPQALVLTAIVISFAIFFYLVSVAVKLLSEYNISSFDDMLDEGQDDE